MSNTPLRLVMGPGAMAALLEATRLGGPDPAEVLAALDGYAAAASRANAPGPSAFGSTSFRGLDFWYVVDRRAGTFTVTRVEPQPIER